MPLFEVAILENPTPKEAKDGAVETVKLHPTCVVAPDDRAAGLKVIMENHAKLQGISPDRMQVLIRPFA